MTPQTLFLTIPAGIFIGIISVTAGGSALITLPFLMILGLNPVAAIATTKLATIGSFITGGIKYNNKKILKHKKIILSLLPVIFLGSYLGANLVLEIDEQVLKILIIIILIFVLLMMAIKKDLGIKAKPINFTKQRYALIFAVIFLLSLYSGFFGAGFGIFTNLALIYLFGLTFLESAAMRTVINFAVMIMALVVFAYNGVIDYTIGVPLFFSTAIGGWIGAHWAVLKGNVLIKRLFVGVTGVLVLKLIFDLI